MFEIGSKDSVADSSRHGYFQNCNSMVVVQKSLLLLLFLPFLRRTSQTRLSVVSLSRFDEKNPTEHDFRFKNYTSSGRRGSSHSNSNLRRKELFIGP